MVAPVDPSAFVATDEGVIAVVGAPAVALGLDPDCDYDADASASSSSSSLGGDDRDDPAADDAQTAISLTAAPRAAAVGALHLLILLGGDLLSLLRHVRVPPGPASRRAPAPEEGGEGGAWAE